MIKYNKKTKRNIRKNKKSRKYKNRKSNLISSLKGGSKNTIRVKLSKVHRNNMNYNPFELDVINYDDLISQLNNKYANVHNYVGVKLISFGREINSDEDLNDVIRNGSTIIVVLRIRGDQP